MSFYHHSTMMRRVDSLAYCQIVYFINPKNDLNLFACKCISFQSSAAIFQIALTKGNNLNKRKLLNVGGSTEPITLL